MASIRRLGFLFRKTLITEFSRQICTKTGENNTLTAVQVRSKADIPIRCERRIDVQGRKLFTPGPLMISDRVKQAMLNSMEIRHAEFAYVVEFVRSSLLQIARVREDEYTVILLQGSGTLATEATLRTIAGGSNKGKLIVMENGMYGRRIAQMCKLSGIKAKVIPVNMKKLQDTLLAASDIFGVIAIHCETSSGLINPIHEIGDAIKRCAPGALFFVDAITTFGALEIDMTNIDFLISNAYECLQGIPGISFVIAKKDKLEKHRCRESAGMVLDIGAQYDELERTSQFRFSPTSHIMVAFKEALMEYSDEGGMAGRAARYRENGVVLKKEMAEIGFNQLYKDDENPDGIIVTSFLRPLNPLFIADEFYNRLCDSGHEICPRKLNGMNSFRVASIGDLHPEDMRSLTNNIRQVCLDMRITLPLQEANF